MKKLIFLFLFFVVSAFTYSANVYFDTPNPGDVYDGRTYYSNATTGRASMTYHIVTVSLWYVVDWYGARIQYPDGHWGDWQDGQSGGWGLTETGTYHIQGAVYVDYDLGGSSDYYMYSNILTFYIVDDNAPSTPQNFQASFPLNQSPVLSWNANSEEDLSGYRVYKKYNGGAYLLNEFTENTSYTDNYFSANYKTGEDVAEYWVVADDINNNVSAETQHHSGSGSIIAWKRNITKEDGEIPNVYNLSQNFPNPFNPSTTIEFQIPQNDFVNLSVYNILGQQVAVLVNNTLGKGKYSVEFNAINLPSGIYIYKIQSDNFNTVKKMILTK